MDKGEQKGHEGFFEISVKRFLKRSKWVQKPRSYLLCAPGRKECEAWITALKKAIPADRCAVPPRGALSFFHGIVSYQQMGMTKYFGF